VLITEKAIALLAARGLLPPLLADVRNQALVIYGNNFADNIDSGWPQPDAPNQALTSEVRNAMSSRIPQGGATVSSTGVNVSFDFSASWHGIPVEPEALIQPSTQIRWLPHDDKHASASLRYMTDVQIWSHESVRDPEWQLEKDIPNEFSLDNLYHYALGDLKDLNDPTIGEGDTRLRMYPLIVAHTAEDDGSIRNEDLSEKLVARSVNQELLVGADYGATKYGAILYQIARKFFESNTVAQPDIRDLVRAGNDVPGWHTGRMQGHGEMAGMQLDFPHTYLGGLPFTCLDSQSFDSCSDGTPTWPAWIKDQMPATDADVRALTTQYPGRSNRAALIYLGWATHMMQDSSLPQHVANWTGKEHQNQDDLGDREYFYKNFSGVTVQNCTANNKFGIVICQTVPHPYSTPAYTQWFLDPYIAPDLDALLGPAGSPKNRDDVCRSLGINDDSLLATGNAWESVQPVFLANARRAYAARQEFLSGDAANSAGREYIKNAVLGTLKLLYCALPQASVPAPEPTRPRVFQDDWLSGAGQRLQPGVYDVFASGARAIRLGNDQISSLDVPPGYAVTLFADAGLSGASMIFPNGSYWSLGDYGFNDAVSSMSVTRYGVDPSFYLRLRHDATDNGVQRSYGARRYIDVRGSGSASADQWLPLKSWSYTGGWSQTFTYDPATHAIKNPTDGLCLDIPWGDPTNGNIVQMYPCHGGVNQQWFLSSDGQIVSGLGKCLEVGGNDMSVGARVQIWDCVGSEMQSFDMVYGCSHDSCQTGPALTGSCSADVAQVCDADPYCCNNYWDEYCVGELPNTCQ
jgi:hypothetical protein